MKTLNFERMENIAGGRGVGCDDGFAQLAAVSLSALGVAAVFTGPIGWGPALLLGAAGMYLGTQHCGAK